MTRAQYAMLMFTQMIIIGRVSPASESGIWEALMGAWFVVMIINLIAQLIDYGKKSKINQGDKNTAG